VTGTGCTGSYKFTYHMITTKTDLDLKERERLSNITKSSKWTALFHCSRYVPDNVYMEKKLK